MELGRHYTFARAVGLASRDWSVTGPPLWAASPGLFTVCGFPLRVWLWSTSGALGPFLLLIGISPALHALTLTFIGGLIRVAFIVSICVFVFVARKQHSRSHMFSCYAFCAGVPFVCSNRDKLRPYI